MESGNMKSVSSYFILLSMAVIFIGIGKKWLPLFLIDEVFYRQNSLHCILIFLHKTTACYNKIRRFVPIP